MNLEFDNDERALENAPFQLNIQSCLHLPLS